jgi:hypothetical protein
MFRRGRIHRHGSFPEYPIYLIGLASRPNASRNGSSRFSDPAHLPHHAFGVGNLIKDELTEALVKVAVRIRKVHGVAHLETHPGITCPCPGKFK